ncbi:MAG: hypothetical protein KTR33_06195 [Gammaproteobacteria bacterium]|nr:hypothetical protein [Gammaproteobacteria bacterium]
MAKSRMHSVLTALPVIMLCVGIYVYFSGEKKQKTSPLIMAQAETLQGEYKGLTEVGSGSWSRHYLWVAVVGADGEMRKRHARITDDEALYLTLPEFTEQVDLEKSQQVTVKAAPTVEGSGVLWVYELSRDGRVIFVRSREP